MGDLFLVPACTDCQHKPTPAEAVNCSELFRDDDRVSHRYNQRRDSESHMICNWSKVSESCDTVKDSLIRSPTVPRHQDMIGGPERVTASIFGLHSHRSQRLSRGRFAVVWNTYAEFHIVSFQPLVDNILLSFPSVTWGPDLGGEGSTFLSRILAN